MHPLQAVQTLRGLLTHWGSLGLMGCWAGPLDLWTSGLVDEGPPQRRLIESPTAPEMRPGGGLCRRWAKRARPFLAMSSEIRALSTLVPAQAVAE